MGYNSLIGVKAADMTSWTDFKSVCKQLRQSAARETFETIIIDTVAIAWTLCEKYILQREMVQKISEIPFGQGWNLLKEEFETTLRELTQLGYGVVLIAHAKMKTTEYTDEEGEAISAYAPDLPNMAYQICNRMVDIIGYIGTEYDLKTGNSFRYLYTRGTPTIFAGSRYRYLEPKIPLSYKNLVDAIAAAMEKEAKETGTTVLDHAEIRAITTRPFSDVMNEAREVWKQLIDTKINTAPNEEEREAFFARMNGIIKRIFGKEMKLSQATDSQQDLLELCIDELRDLL